MTWTCIRPSQYVDTARVQRATASRVGRDHACAANTRVLLLFHLQTSAPCIPSCWCVDGMMTSTRTRVLRVCLFPAAIKRHKRSHDDGDTHTTPHDNKHTVTRVRAVRRQICRTRMFDDHGAHDVHDVHAVCMVTRCGEIQLFSNVPHEGLIMLR